MRILKQLCIISLITSINANCQNKARGIITYSTSTKMINEANKSNNSDNNRIKKLFKSMTDFGENLKLLLYFDNNLAYFTCETSLQLNKENERIYNLAKVKFKTMANYYYDLKKYEYLEEKDFGGDIFLIKKNINITDWNLVNETKKIGNYICYKATRNLNYTNWKKKQSIRKQTVWYTLDIPLPLGPKEFVGFPGLVIKVEDHNLIYEIKKINLNPQKKIALKKPNKGKEMSQDEFNKILEGFSTSIRNKVKNE